MPCRSASSRRFTPCALSMKMLLAPSSVSFFTRDSARDHCTPYWTHDLCKVLIEQPCLLAAFARVSESYDCRVSLSCILDRLAPALLGGALAGACESLGDALAVCEVTASTPGRRLDMDK